MDDPTSPGKKAWVNPALQPLPVEEPRQVISINIITMDGQRAKIEGVVGDRLLDAIKNSEGMLHLTACAAVTTTTMMKVVSWC